MLAGFLSLFQPRARYAGRVLNIHPALICRSVARFDGHRVHEAVLAAGRQGERLHGALRRRAGMTAAPIVLQGCVPVLDDDTPETLAARVLALEHEPTAGHPAKRRGPPARRGGGCASPPPADA
ncbi:MAG: formyltransferase family protein [Candidatus Binatia bacterium]